MAVTVPKAVLVGGSSALSRHIKPLTRQWRVGNYAKEMLDGGGRETLLDDVGICMSFGLIATMALHRTGLCWYATAEGMQQKPLKQFKSVVDVSHLDSPAITPVARWRDDLVETSR